MPQPEKHAICALLIGVPDENDRFLQEVFEAAGWRLLQAPDRVRAVEYLRRTPIQVVIADDSGKWDWKDVLEKLRRMAHPPQLIVTSRQADEQLWAEVLNCGGYDLLQKPLRRDEIERVVAAARRHYDRPVVRAAGGGTPRASVA